jgi:Lamin Tail Domain
MSRLLSAAVSVAALVGGVLTVATPAEAATPRVEITKVYYDSPGKDTGSNTSLNNEWVRLTSRRTFTVNLKGWTIRDLAGHVYTFRSDFRLGPGERVWIHTGTGTNTATDRYWNRGWYVWNNSGDRATLRNADGNVVDRCSWDGGRPGYTYCR